MKMDFLPLMFCSGILLVCPQALHGSQVDAGPVGRGGQHFTEEPHNKTVTGGDEVILPCVVANIQGICQWTKDGFGLGTKWDLPGFPRYHMGEPGCSLIISPVLIEDEGSYQCQVIPKTPGQGDFLTSEPAYLAVFIEPGEPHILEAVNEDEVEVMVKESVELSCRSEGARPPGEILWKDEDGTIIEGLHHEEVTRMPDNEKTFRTLSKLSFTPKSDMTITCSVVSEVYQEPKVTRPLAIKIMTTPKVGWNMTETSFIEGEKLTLECFAQGYPEDFHFNWYINGNIMEDQTESLLSLGQLNKDMNKAELMCAVDNRVGRGEIKGTITVMFAPKFVLKPQSKVAKVGEIVTFTCKVDASPEPTYVWIKQSTNTIKGVSQNLSLMVSSESLDGYICKSFIEGFGEITSEPAYIQILSAPEVTVDLEVYAKVGHPTVLHCMVETLSFQTSVSWTKNSVPLGPSFVKERVTQDGLKIIISSDLVLVNVTASDFVPYGCFASNDVGTDFKEILVQKEPESLMFTIPWVLAIVVFSSCVMFIIFQQWRRIIKFLSCQTCFGRMHGFDHERHEMEEAESLNHKAPIYKGDEDLDAKLEEVLLNGGIEDDYKYRQMCREYSDEARPTYLRQRSTTWSLGSSDTERERRGTIGR